MQQQNIITKTAAMVNTVPRVATTITSGLTVYKRISRIYNVHTLLHCTEELICNL